MIDDIPDLIPEGEEPPASADETLFTMGEPPEPPAQPETSTPTHPVPEPTAEPDAPPDEAKEKARAEMVATLRTLIRDVCASRFGAVPAEVAALVADEPRLGALQSWYIAAGTRSADDLVVFVQTSRQD